MNTSIRSTASNNSMREDDELTINRIGPWKNKEEFLQVYRLIFSIDTDPESQQLACEMMTVWKLRRHNLTPASVLSTLAILEVQLKDDPNCNIKITLDNLRILYSNAFTRFLNYMSSIMQNKYLKTMYTTAKELGLESFLVDLRHLCAHGQVMPTLEVFRRTAGYCMNWLDKFYWQRECEAIQDAYCQDVRLKQTVEFQENIQSLLTIYDATTEALHRRFRNVTDIEVNQQDDPFDPVALSALKEYSGYIKNGKLTAVLANLVNQLTDYGCAESKVRGNAEIYCDVLFGCRYFMESAATYVTNSKDSQRDKKNPANDFIGIHQNLFRSLAICGFVQTCFNGLIDICEDDGAPLKRRQGAQFWVNQIVIGFMALKNLKRVMMTKKEKNKKFIIDLEPLNTDVMNKEVRQIYKDLDVSCSGTLIFGDTIRRPWTLVFDRKYISDRMTNINVYTKEVVGKCISLVEPALSEEQETHLKGLIDVYISGGRQNKGDLELSMAKGDENIIHTVDKDFLMESDVVVAAVNEKGDKRYGCWSEVSDDINWQSAPLGRLPWE